MAKQIALATAVLFATVCFVLLIGIFNQVQSATLDCVERERSLCTLLRGVCKKFVKNLI